MRWVENLSECLLVGDCEDGIELYWKGDGSSTQCWLSEKEIKALESFIWRRRGAGSKIKAMEAMECRSQM
jgi:hypothetical protein